jgi:2-methylcitrate dehydratase PrpD
MAGGESSGTVTAAIADFAMRTDLGDVPAAAMARAKVHVLDSLGLAFAGAVSEAAGIVRGHLADQGMATEARRPGAAAIVGTPLSAPPRFAAWANGTAIHADNFDDTTPQVRADRTGGIHASGAVLPVAIALAETRGSTGAEFLISYLIGVEISSRLNHAMAARHYGDGFHATGTLTVFGAAAAAGRLMGLDRDGHIRAQGLAASFASGVRRNFGTMAEILHPGHSAECGIVAADLARRGMTAAADALDGPVGYFAAAGGGFDAGEIVGKLGNPWAFEDPGVWIKPHPNGALTHPGAAALLKLMRDGGVSAGDIRGIRVRTNRRVLNTLIHHDPADAMQGKFSMEFTLALVAVTGQAGLSEFTDAMLARADVRDMMKRIVFSAYDEVGQDFTNVTTLVEVELSDGRRLSGRADHAAGSTRSPMSYDEVAAKFRQCVEYGRYPSDRAEQVVEAVAAIEYAGTVGRLAALLTK